jgi:hypothetical protein
MGGAGKRAAVTECALAGWLARVPPLALFVLLAIPACGCTGLAPVPRPPWVEDRSLELRREELRVELDRSGVLIEARFEFVGATSARELGFPIGGPARAVDLEAVAMSEDRERHPLAVRLGKAGPLPSWDAVEHWDIAVPDGVLGRAGTALIVRYRHRGSGPFRYILATGAYWSGPIGELDVIVSDPEERVGCALLDGFRAHERKRERMAWHFVDFEPKDVLWIEAR